MPANRSLCRRTVSSWCSPVRCRAARRHKGHSARDGGPTGVTISAGGVGAMSNIAGRFYSDPLMGSAYEVRRHWGWFMGLGIAMVILGIIALGDTVLVT